MNVHKIALRSVCSPSIEREDLVLKRHDHGHVTFSVKNERFTVNKTVGFFKFKKIEVFVEVINI